MKVTIVLTFSKEDVEELSASQVAKLVRTELEALNDCAGFGEEGICYQTIQVKSS